MSTHQVGFALGAYSSNWICLQLQSFLNLKSKMSKSYSSYCGYSVVIEKDSKKLEIGVECNTVVTFSYSEDRSTIFINVDLQQNEKEKFINIFKFQIPKRSDINELYSHLMKSDYSFVDREELSDSIYRSMLIKSINDVVIRNLLDRDNLKFKFHYIDGFIRKSVGDVNFKDAEFIESLCFYYRWVFHYWDKERKGYYLVFQDLNCMIEGNALESVMREDESILYSQSPHFIVLTNNLDMRKDII